MTAWAGGSLLIQSTGALLPVMLPALSPERAPELIGYAVSVCCPTGCIHTLAVEPEFNLAFEVAAARLEMAGAWSNGLLLGGWFLTEHREPYEALKAACDADWRGRVN